MSKPFLKWTIDAIRDDKSLMHWLDERKFEWVPLAKNTVTKLLKGHSIIILTDSERDWFATYILSTINTPYKSRPSLPFFELKNFYPHIDLVRDNKDIDVILDMLSISFEQGFIIWYIGSNYSKRLDIAKKREDSFLWLLDEEAQNSFFISQLDELFDIKLLQLFKLFDKTISASIFSEVDLSA
jgi:hypothetical protein